MLAYASSAGFERAPRAGIPHLVAAREVDGASRGSRRKGTPPKEGTREMVVACQVVWKAGERRNEAEPMVPEVVTG